MLVNIQQPMPQGRVGIEGQDDGREAGRNQITRSLVYSKRNRVSDFKSVVADYYQFLLAESAFQKRHDQGRHKLRFPKDSPI